MQKLKKKVIQKKTDPLAHFPIERKKALESIKRYDIFSTMFYRTNDWIHTNRVSWLTKELIPVAKKFFRNIDEQKAILLALVHDDTEIIMGDYNASHKDFGNKTFLSKIYKEEESAIEILSKRYPQFIGKYNYKDLLIQAKDWEGIEGKIVCYADKLDAYCESIHDVLAGNISLLPSVIYCADRMARFEQKYPEIKEFFNYTDSPLTNLKVTYPVSFLSSIYNTSFNKPFGNNSIKIKTVFSAYEKWKEITLKYGKQEGKDALTKQKEFYK